ncbi:MAG: Gfo/Idh/MocA family oxidoreductase [Vicinamibacteria bacterium]|nr:Gfo/Idh/MocA family oxidoreductase [Vicinamibacteria bacterium]
MDVALVGLGEAGFTIHLPALAALGSATVVGAVDPDRSRRDRAGAKFGVPVFAGFDDMLADARPDVVLVATPPDTHSEYCLRAIAAGAHVICEKPFVSSVAEADRVLAAAAAAGRQIAVNHQFRHMPIFEAVRVEARRIGDISFAQVWQLMDLPPATESGWRGQLVQRTLYEAGIHLVDFLVALFGERPLAVSASMSAGPGGGSADAIALVTLEFSRGRLAQITQNRLCAGPRQYFEVRAETGDASLRASFGGRSRVSAGLYRGTRPHLRFDYGASGLAWSEHGSRRTVLARNPRQPMVMATRQVLGRSLEAFRTGEAPPTSGADARNLLAIVAACYQSAATGSRVPLDAETDARLSTLRLGNVSGR